MTKYINQFSSSNLVQILFLSLGLVVPLFSLAYSYIFYGFPGRTVSIYLLLIVLLILFINQISNNIKRITIFLISSFIISLLSFIEISHFIIFKELINGSSIFIILETNLSESSEFVSSYLHSNILVIGLFHLLSLLISSVYFFANSKNFSIRIFKKQPKYIFIVWLLLSTYTIFSFRANFFPYILAQSTIAFIDQRRAVFKVKISNNGNFNNVVHNNSAEKETYVIIVGESTTRSHMSLYGYYRNTNPLLSERKDKLVIYNNVSTSHSHTITALSDALAINNPDSIILKYNKTLIQLMNAAGFNTFFISNQKPIGIYETTVTLLSKASNEKVYTNVSRSTYDEAVLAPLKQVLNKESKKKFIVIHLMGTHQEYQNRYPKEFTYFKDKPKTKFNHDIAYRTINAYDNAVLYNDFIVNSIINEVAKNDDKAYVIYFSDHGEDVYETIDEACHTESKGTEPMFKIPFIVWLSSKFKAEMPNNWVWDTNRYFNNRNLLFTVSDLSQIDFQSNDSNKSLFSSYYSDTININIGNQQVKP